MAILITGKMENINSSRLYSIVHDACMRDANIVLNGMDEIHERAITYISYFRQLGLYNGTCVLFNSKKIYNGICIGISLLSKKEHKKITDMLGVIDNKITNTAIGPIFPANLMEGFISEIYYTDDCMMADISRSAALLLSVEKINKI